MTCKIDAQSGGIVTPSGPGISIIETVIPADASTVQDVIADIPVSFTDKVLGFFENRNPLVLAVMIAAVLALLKKA